MFLFIFRKCKFLQKTCIISLAIADIFSVIMFATNNLETLSQTLIIWVGIKKFLSLGMTFFQPFSHLPSISKLQIILLRFYVKFGVFL